MADGFGAYVIPRSNGVLPCVFIKAVKAKAVIIDGTGGIALATFKVLEK